MLEKNKLSYQIQLLQLIKKKIQSKTGLFNYSDSDDLISHVTDSFTMESIYKYLYQSKSIKVLEFIKNSNENYDELIDKYENDDQLKQEYMINTSFKSNNVFDSLKYFILCSFYLTFFNIKKIYYTTKMISRGRIVLLSIILTIIILLLFYKNGSFEQKSKNYRLRRPQPKLYKVYKLLDKVWFSIAALFE